MAQACGVRGSSGSEVREMRDLTRNFQGGSRGE